jgi:hypothetical protein
VLRCRRIEIAGAHQPRPPEDGVERCTKLVGKVGKKLFLGSVGLSHFRKGEREAAADLADPFGHDLRFVGCHCGNQLACQGSRRSHAPSAPTAESGGGGDEQRKRNSLKSRGNESARDDCRSDAK